MVCDSDVFWLWFICSAGILQLFHLGMECRLMNVDGCYVLLCCKCTFIGMVVLVMQHVGCLGVFHAIPAGLNLCALFMCFGLCIIASTSWISYCSCTHEFIWYWFTYAFLTWCAWQFMFLWFILHLILTLVSLYWNKCRAWFWRRLQVLVQMRLFSRASSRDISSL